MSLWFLALTSAWAVRPTEGGMFSFDDTDVVASWDEASGVVRVHYSTEGPNLVRQGDADADGVPDFAQSVAETAAEVILFYRDDIGLRSPLRESEVGLSALGGSDAFDFYLVDFGGNADGMFSPDGCTGGHCAGHMAMENDFQGYGYGNIQYAIEVLTSHELFHAVQNAYASDQPIWFAEGTAVWGELQWDADSQDFMYFAESYLEETDRSLDKPPSGPVPAFAYGTCLWWDFLTTRHDVPLMLALQTSTDTGSGDYLLDMAGLLEERGDTLADAWVSFASYNLATGDRAGFAESHRYADRLDGLTVEAEGSAIDEDNRYYPLSATYYRLDHGGGPLWFGLEDAAPSLHFALHPVANGAADGPVEDAIATWYGDEAVAAALLEGADLAEGGYWLVVSNPTLDEDSTKVRLCLGDEATATACAPAAEEEPVEEEKPGGCSTAPVAPYAASLFLAAIFRRRSRR